MLLLPGLLLLAAFSFAEGDARACPAATDVVNDADFAVLQSQIDWYPKPVIAFGQTSTPAGFRAGGDPRGVTAHAAHRAVTGPASGAAGTVSAGPAFLGYARFLVQSSWQITTAPARWHLDDWRIFSLSVVSVGAVASVDRPIRDLTQRNRSHGFDDAITVIERFGAEYSFGVLGAFFLTGYGLNDSTATNVAWDGVASMLIASQIIAPSLKDTFGRYRPFQTEDVYTFAPFSGHSSFPSGHATRAFSVASVIATHYDPLWVKATAYGIAGVVALARVYHNVHFASDVVAGGLVGTCVGRAVVHFRQRRTAQTSPQVSLIPFHGGGCVGVTVTATI